MRSRKMCVAIFTALLFIVLFTCGSCGKKQASISKEVKVLSINTNILKGRTIGDFLSPSNSNSIGNVVVVGIKTNFGNKMFLFDIKLTYSEIAYYENKTTLPINWTLESYFFSAHGCMLYGYLNDREVVKMHLSLKLANQLYEELEYDRGS